MKKCHGCNTHLNLHSNVANGPSDLFLLAQDLTQGPPRQLVAVPPAHSPISLPLSRAFTFEKCRSLILWHFYQFAFVRCFLITHFKVCVWGRSPRVVFEGKAMLVNSEGLSTNTLASCRRKVSKINDSILLVHQFESVHTIHLFFFYGSCFLRKPSGALF